MLRPRHRQGSGHLHRATSDELAPIFPPAYHPPHPSSIRSRSSAGERDKRLPRLCLPSSPSLRPPTTPLATPRFAAGLQPAVSPYAYFRLRCIVSPASFPPALALHPPAATTQYRIIRRIRSLSTIGRVERVSLAHPRPLPDVAHQWVPCGRRGEAAESTRVSTHRFCCPDIAGQSTSLSCAKQPQSLLNTRTHVLQCPCCQPMSNL